MKAIIVLGIFCSLFTNSLTVLSQATAYANIYAEVVAPVGVRNTSSLHFGEIVVSRLHKTAESTEVIANPTNDVNFKQSGSVTLISFSITDALHSTYDITLPSEKIAIKDDYSNTLTISNFTSKQAIPNRSQGSKMVITVGADFNFPENHFNGRAQSQNQFPVTINYN